MKKATLSFLLFFVVLIHYKFSKKQVLKIASFVFPNIKNHYSTAENTSFQELKSGCITNEQDHNIIFMNIAKALNTYWNRIYLHNIKTDTTFYSWVAGTAISNTIINSTSSFSWQKIKRLYNKMDNQNISKLVPHGNLKDRATQNEMMSMKAHTTRPLSRVLSGTSQDENQTSLEDTEKILPMTETGGTGVLEPAAPTVSSSIKHAKNPTLCMTDEEKIKRKNKKDTIRANRLKTLRSLMEKHKVDMYVLFNTDEHNSEMINAKDKKIYFLTNFSGTGGTLIVTKTGKSILFVATLFELQVFREVDTNMFDIIIETKSNRDAWIEEIIKRKPNTIAVDGKATPLGNYDKLLVFLNGKSNPFMKVKKEFVFNNDFSKITVKEDTQLLLMLEKSLININDKVNEKPIFILEVKYCGLAVEQKLEKIKDFFEEEPEIKYLLVSNLDEIAYILNLRGYDFPYTPVFYAYLLFEYNREKKDFEKIVLFTRKKNVNHTVEKYLRKNKIVVEEYETFLQYIKNNMADKVNEKFIPTTDKQTDSDKEITKKSLDDEDPELILLDMSISAMVYYFFKDSEIYLYDTPIKMMKAIKNETEIANMLEAHILDAIALLRFFTWVDIKKKNNLLFQETELSLSHKVDEFRSQRPEFISLSFPTISAIGKNSAVIHYEPTKESNCVITPSMYLLDSGGQYLSGTTDVTRTTHFGVPTPMEKKAYTLVLKGHLRLRKVIFPPYVDSKALDFLARSYLTQHYYDYKHGTGHGVGQVLSVHEVGYNIAPYGGTFLEENMVVSNEPGVYFENQFGVRLENMQYVVNEEAKGHPGFMAFVDLTLYPYDTNLFDFNLLTKEEIQQINEYHAYIKKILLPIVKLKKTEYGPEVAEYLERITKPITIENTVEPMEHLDDHMLDSTTDEIVDETADDTPEEKSGYDQEEKNSNEFDKWKDIYVESEITGMNILKSGGIQFQKKTINDDCFEDKTENDFEKRLASEMTNN